MAAFIPRPVFEHLSSIPRAYFLGHHAAAVSKMKHMWQSVDLVIECRDYRTPLASRNPLFEQEIGDRPRLIVYTHHDLGSKQSSADAKRDAIISSWDAPIQSAFSDKGSRSTIRKILDFAREQSRKNESFFPTRMMVVGMPNVGKSSLLNALRNVSLGKKKAAITGDKPGVTRKIATGVKILPAEEGREPTYLLDTPGVSIPFVPDAESMLKLALCGNVKDTYVPPTTVADYLLFHLNLNDPGLYSEYSEPTNDIFELLDKLARKQGRLKKGGMPDHESAALQLIHRWRTGHLGKFILDVVTEDALKNRLAALEEMGGSLNQAKKKQKEESRKISAAQMQSKMPKIA